jgi:hypothetical protein
MMRQRLAAAFLAGLLALTGQSAVSQQAKRPASAQRLVTVTLERAPGELGKAVSGGLLYVATADKGKEVVLFDSGSGEVKSFLETGAAAAEPVRLRGRTGDRFSPVAFRMAASDDAIAFSSPLGVSLFKRETGELLAEAPYLHHAADVAALPDGTWAVSLMRLPFPEIARADKEKFGGPAPRFVVVNDKLEISGQGPADDADRTPNQTAARALRLAASANRLFAAEIANYKVYEFDHAFKLRSTYTDPRLKLEEGVGLAADQQQQQERFLAEARDRMGRAGTDATRPGTAGQAAPARAHANFFQYQMVVWDVAWDPVSHQVIMLLAPGIAGEHAALDLLDPATGEVQRLLLRLPPETAQMELSQLAIGHRYLWLRGHEGGNPTLRLDRSELEQARPITGPQVDRFAVSK